jgi:hypothetical protein
VAPLSDQQTIVRTAVATLRAIVIILASVLGGAMYGSLCIVIWVSRVSTESGVPWIPIDLPENYVPA